MAWRVTAYTLSPLQMESVLAKQVVGQPEALQVVSDAAPTPLATTTTQTRLVLRRREMPPLCAGAGGARRSAVSGSAAVRLHARRTDRCARHHASIEAPRALSQSIGGTQPVPRGVGSLGRAPRSERYRPSAYSVIAGTGKTQLCKALAEFLFDSPEVACIGDAHSCTRGEGGCPPYACITRPPRDDATRRR